MFYTECELNASAVIKEVITFPKEKDSFKYDIPQVTQVSKYILWPCEINASAVIKEVITFPKEKDSFQLDIPQVTQVSKYILWPTKGLKMIDRVRLNDHAFLV